MIKVVYNQTKDDGLTYVIGEDNFNNDTPKEEINKIIENALTVYKRTMIGCISCTIMEQDSKGKWVVPINPKTLRNEL